MRATLLVIAGLVGCVGGAPADPGTGADASMMNNGVCPLPGTTTDTGTLSATAAQRCNVSGSGGTMHWYRLAAKLPSGAMDFVQVELWDNTGAFAAGVVHAGTFQLAGVETDYATCGVCVRGIGDKGATGAKEYFATSGTVVVNAVGTTAGTPFSATVSNLTLIEIDAVMHKPVASGCSAQVAHAQVDGTVVDVGGTGGTGGGGGGGGGGGSGSGSGGGQCPAGVGD